MGDEAWSRIEASNEALKIVAHAELLAYQKSYHAGVLADVKKEAAAGNSTRLDAFRTQQRASGKRHLARPGVKEKRDEKRREKRREKAKLQPSKVKVMPSSEEKEEHEDKENELQSSNSMHAPAHFPLFAQQK
jgi:hypothetical protein